MNINFIINQNLRNFDFLYSEYESCKININIPNNKLNHKLKLRESKTTSHLKLNPLNLTQNITKIYDEESLNLKKDLELLQYKNQ